MEKKFTKITDKNKWQNLLNRVLFKTFFHFWDWEEFLESQFKWLKFERYIWENRALLSMARVGNRLISHPFCEYGGPLPLIEKIDGRVFQKDVLEEFKTPFKISFHPQLLNYFKGMEFPENQRETFLFENLHIQNTDWFWEKMDRNRHRAIKTAESQGFEIKKCQNLKELKELYNFYIKNLKEHKALVYPFSFFRFFFQNPQAEILLVERRKELVGGNIFLLYDKILHSFLCGFDGRYKNFGAHSLILWEQIKRAKEKNCQIFDFGATRKDSTIRDFKERWGAKAYPIFELSNYSGQSRLRESKLRNIYALLPTFLMKKLSPHLLRYKL